MGTGYHVEVNRRYGGHSGHSTEWEISTDACTGRVRRLQHLDHPLLVAFAFHHEGCGSFCVLREDERPGAKQLVPLLVAYLTAWPGDEESEALEHIAKGCR